MDILSSIKSIEFFNTLNDEQINYLIDISAIRSFSKDTIVYFESDVDYSLQFLNNEIFLYHINKGNMISELTSMDSESIYCFSNAAFVEDGVILSINFKKFKSFFIDSGLLASQFIKEILEKSHQLQCIINRELVFDSTAKVAHMLYHDLEMFNNQKKTHISFMLHIQPETLSRVLKRFTRDMIIEVIDKTYVIKDEEKLASIFKGIGL